MPATSTVQRTFAGIGVNRLGLPVVGPRVVTVMEELF